MVQLSSSIVLVGSSLLIGWLGTSVHAKEALPSSTEQYNLIRTNLRCRTHKYAALSSTSMCPHLVPNDMISIVPNERERADMTAANYARLFPVQYKASVSGFTKPFATDGTVTNGGCGIAQRKPYWVHPSAMEGSHWQAVSRSDCTGGVKAAHATCSDDCTIFNATGCSAGLRNKAFRTYTSAGFPNAEAEGPMNALMTQDTSHCGIFFNPTRMFFAMGNVKNPITGNTFRVTNAWASGQLATLPNFQHPIPTGAHFNKTAVNAALTTKPLVFRAVHYRDYTSPVKSTIGYVRFRGVLNQMTRVAGNATRGVYEFETTASTSTTSACEPYHFVFKQTTSTSVTTEVTLPQDAANYRFGTKGFKTASGVVCDENHYYKHTDGKWYANRTPDATGKTTTCFGCSLVV